MYQFYRWHVFFFISFTLAQSSIYNAMVALLDYRRDSVSAQA